MKPLTLSLHQCFEQQKLKQEIDACTDLDQLKEVTKQLIGLYFAQKAATAWVLDDALSGSAPTAFN